MNRPADSRPFRSDIQHTMLIVAPEVMDQVRQELLATRLAVARLEARLEDGVQRQLLSPREVGSRYRVDPRTVRADCHAGRLRCMYRQGRGGQRGALIDLRDAAELYGVESITNDAGAS
ncbi:MAG: hypothetical protein AAB263_19150 [Planctomycetota bacterium]|mgnify:CR=1 FL=1